MTKLQRKQHKLGNAMRAFVGGWLSVPQKQAIHRVNRWKARLTKSK